jgi:hypothetical protein
MRNAAGPGAARIARSAGRLHRVDAGYGRSGINLIRTVPSLTLCFLRQGISFLSWHGVIYIYFPNGIPGYYYYYFILFDGALTMGTCRRGHLVEIVS